MSDGTSQFTVAVSIKGKHVVLKIDTAASVVGEHTYRSQLSESPLRSTGLCLKSYSGGTISILGEIQVPVVYSGESIIL